MHSRAETLLPIEIDEWQGHLGAVLQGAPDWEVRGAPGQPNACSCCGSCCSCCPAGRQCAGRQWAASCRLPTRPRKPSVSMIAGVQRSANDSVL